MHSPKWLLPMWLLPIHPHKLFTHIVTAIFTQMICRPTYMYIRSPTQIHIFTQLLIQLLRPLSPLLRAIFGVQALLLSHLWALLLCNFPPIYPFNPIICLLIYFIFRSSVYPSMFSHFFFHWFLGQAARDLLSESVDEYMKHLRRREAAARANSAGNQFRRREVRISVYSPSQRHLLGNLTSALHWPSSPPFTLDKQILCTHRGCCSITPNGLIDLSRRLAIYL